MIRVFGFLLGRSMRNRFVRRLARLREPRYLIPTVVSLGWIGFWMSRAFTRGHVRMGTFSWAEGPGGLREGLVLLGSIVIFLYIALLWLLPSKQAALEFSPAEVHFLFPAPVTRKQIVHYKLLRAQIGILFGASIAAFFWSARMLSVDGLSRLAGFWLMFATFQLHSIGAGFVRNGLIEQGITGLRRRILPLVIVVLFIVGAVMGTLSAWPLIVDASRGVVQADGDISGKRLGAFLEVIAHVGTSGLLGAVLWPFQILPRLVLSVTPAEFARWFLIGFALLLAHYLWVIRSDTAFEEASLELSQKIAARRARTGRSGRRAARIITGARAFPWKLSPTGRPEVAIVWKNLISISRVIPVRALIGLTAFLIAIIGWTVGLSSAGTAIGAVVVVLLAQVAGVAALFGPLFMRNDLREDLFRIDQIKPLPITGHALVWGEVLAPWAVLTLIELVAMSVGMGTLLLSGVRNVGRLNLPWLMAIGTAAMFVLPALTLASVALQNALVLIFPAWVSLGTSRARGFEASGQRILTLFGTLIVNGVVALPAAISGAAVTFLLAGVMGSASLVLGGVVTAAWIVVEVWFGCRLLGRLFDRLDPSTAGIEAQDD